MAKKTTIKSFTADEYREKFTETALRDLLEFADRESADYAVLQEVPKIREALGQETLTTAEIREHYAYRYAAARDPFPYQSDIQAGRAEFDAWLAAHDETR